MRKHALIVVLVTALFVTAGVLMDVLGRDKGSPGLVLPPSLDAHYPPQAREPVYLLQMLALGNAFTGVISDLLAGDAANAEAGFSNFKTLYGEIAKLVPEWQGLYPAGPVAEAEAALKAAVQAGNPGPFMGTVETLGRVCGSCHHEHMAAVQHRYHWKDFAKVTAKDPGSGRDLPYARFMQALNLGYTGSWIDFGQAQPESALKRFGEFNAAYQELKDSCAECHGTSERRYYVDTGSQALVDAYGRGLSADPADPKKAQEAMMAVGTEICFKCHLVHVPAAYAGGR